MAAVDLQDLTRAVFRANPRYRLVSFDHLPPGEQEALAGIRQNPELFGVLIPAETENLPVKSVCHETARLFSALAEPGEIPDRFKSEPDRRLNQEFAELVLDEVLEIAFAQGFVCGAAAYPIVFRNALGHEGMGRLARLSVEALQYAAALQMDDAIKLSARIYFYNRIPVTSSCKHLWPHEEAVLRYLGVGRGAAPRSALTSDYLLAPTSGPYSGWLTWTHRDRVSSRRNDKAFYKLYISPLPTHVKEALAAIVAILTHRWCPRFKIGSDAYGLLRPDKMVCYFEDFDDLMGFADALKPTLAGCPAHGVPFSASLTPDGLLSWGIDPPRDESRPAWMESESWRLWVSNRLASALIAAEGEANCAIEPWRFAMERLRLAGVDTETWTPNDPVWLRTGAGQKE